MKFIILACLIAVASAGVINQAAPLAYSSSISAVPQALSYSNVYNSPIFRSAAPYYQSVSPLAYNAIPSYNSYASPIAYNNGFNGYSGYGYSPLTYNAAPAVQPLVSPVLRNPYLRSYPYPLY